MRWYNSIPCVTWPVHTCRNESFRIGDLDALHVDKFSLICITIPLPPAIYRPPPPLPPSPSIPLPPTACPSVRRSRSRAPSSPPFAASTLLPQTSTSTPLQITLSTLPLSPSSQPPEPSASEVCPLRRLRLCPLLPSPVARSSLPFKASS